MVNYLTSFTIFFICLFLISIFSFYSKAQNNRLTEQYFHIDSIRCFGNKITKRHIILRELQYKENDSIIINETDEIIKKTKENLLNTSLFNFVNISYIKKNRNTITININVLERWYTWASPIFEISDRNFNSWLSSDDKWSKLSYGFLIVRKNFRGRKEELKLLFRQGYDRTIAFSYYIPYLNLRQTLGIGFFVGNTDNHKVAYITDENKQLFNKTSDTMFQRRYYTAIQLTYRQNIKNTHYLQSEYQNYTFNNSLLLLNKNYAINEVTKNSFFIISYKFKSDFRDNKAYPLNGYYFDVDVSKFGLSFKNNRVPNQITLHTSIRKYLRLSKNYYFSTALNMNLVNKKAEPYYLASMVGNLRDNIRGYDYYVINGQYFAVGKINFKYVILPETVSKLKFIPTEKFSKIHYALYLNFFSDLGYVYDNNFYKNNKLANQFLYSSGIGIDLVTYYDKVLRIEYTINKLFEKGIFINFVAPL